MRRTMRGTSATSAPSRPAPRRSRSPRRTARSSARTSCRPARRSPSIDQVDRPGVRIASAPRAAYDLWLERNLRHAELVRSADLDGSFELFVEQGLDALAGLRPGLLTNAQQLARLAIARRQLLVGPAGDGHAARSGRGRVAYLREFVEEMKATGFVADAHRRARRHRPHRRPCGDGLTRARRPLGVAAARGSLRAGNRGSDGRGSVRGVHGAARRSGRAHGDVRSTGDDERIDDRDEARPRRAAHAGPAGRRRSASSSSPARAAASGPATTSRTTRPLPAR